VRRDFVRQWMAKAAGDLKVARHLLVGDADMSFGAAFHAQQAAEKALKAALVWHQVDFPKTHDMSRLVELVRSADARLALVIADAVNLTPYGVEVRYPADLPEPTRDEAQAAVALAERVLEAVLGLLPTDPGFDGLLLK
jgi:HEPN domain-containing protein